MPTIRVEMFEGRTVEQKRALAQALTEATVRTLGGSPEAVEHPVLRHREARLGDGRQAVERAGEAGGWLSTTAASSRNGFRRSAGCRTPPAATVPG